MEPKNAVKLDRSVGRFVYKLHLFLYRISFGLIGHRTPEGPVLLLSTVGRKSKVLRTTPLLYVPDNKKPAEIFYVVGSNGGRPQSPNWILNLQANSNAIVQAGRRRYKVSASILKGSEKDEIWETLVGFYKGWSYYETLTERSIYPVRLRVEMPLSRSQVKKAFD